MTPKNPAAVALGRKGGKATAEKRTAEERSEAARKAVEARWAKTKKLVEEITIGSKELLKRTKATAAVVRTKKARVKKEKQGLYDSQS
jgi:hypothetical protein